MGKPKRQHITPNFYLKKFANKENKDYKIWRCSRDKCERKSTRKITEYQIYTLQDIGILNPYFIEDSLSIKENKIAKVLDGIENNKEVLYITKKKLIIIKEFLIISYYRNYHYLTKIKDQAFENDFINKTDIISKLIKDISIIGSIYKYDDKYKSIIEANIFLEQYNELLKLKNKKFKIPPQINIKNIIDLIWVLSFYTNIFLNNLYSVYNNTDIHKEVIRYILKDYINNDNFLSIEQIKYFNKLNVFILETKQEFIINDRAIILGLNNNHVKYNVIFPINKNKVLVFIKKNKKKKRKIFYKKINKKETDEINKYIASNAVNYIFGSNEYIVKQYQKYLN